MVPHRRSAAPAAAIVLAIAAAATTVFAGALIAGRRGRELLTAPPVRPPSAARAQLPALGATVFAPSAVLNADVASSVPESNTESEWTVRRIAFIGQSDDLAYTVNKAFPHPPALYRLPFDAAAGRYAPTGTVLAGLPSEQRAYLDVVGGPALDGVVAQLQAWDLDDLDRSLGAPRDLVLVARDGLTLTNLTEGCCMIDGYALTPDGAAVLGIDAGGDLVRIELATRARTTLASGLKTPAGGGGGTFAIAPDGSRIALGQTDGPGAAAVRIVDAATGATLDVLPLPGAAMPEVAFSPDGARLYVLEATPAPGAVDGAAFTARLGVYDLAQRTHLTLADLSRATGRTALPAELVSAAGRLFVVHGPALYSVDTHSGAVGQVSPPGTTVLGSVVARPVAGGVRVAYVKAEPVAVGGITQHVRQLVETTVLP